MSFKEVGRITLRSFMKLYKHYKNNFDLEMRLKNKNMTYEELYNQSQKNNRWF